MLRMMSARMKSIALALSYVLCGPAGAAGVPPQASQAAESCHTWPTARTLIGVSGTIGAAGYIMIFDANAPPADGAVQPVAWAQALQAGSFYIWYGSSPQGFAGFQNGIVVCASSTGPLTKTAYSTNTVFSAQVQ